MPKFNLNDHQCKAVVICCMDFRIYKNLTLHEFLLSDGIDSYDLISLPGAGKAIIDFSSRQIILDAIRTSMELHKSEVIYVIHHRDCGAYGGSSRFESPEIEFVFHEKQLKEADEIIKRFLIKTPAIKKVFFDSVDGELVPTFIP
jgi:carbonic anhydrase